ncbi:MAG: VTT domain-containing protein [Deltaproteobacteria bacterium]|nr:VTT domain-containing protein [Deltaproteobacteria bacterium]MBK8693536.1 VTT domain-containing protein [Deltaproteobacteria bacterium]MBP6833974.1 VTT domain-containing protein [Deltaproteobacteria bacterium]
MGRDRLRILARAWPAAVMLIAPWVALQAPFVRAAIVDLADRMHQGQPIALLQYVIGYCLGAMILLPKALLSGLAGYAYGPVKGLCAALPAATLGACCSFGLGRLLAKTSLGRMLTETPRFRLVDTVVRTDGLRISILLRLAPVMPQPLLSLLLGATALPLRHLVISMLVGLLPATVIHVYVGSLVRSALELMATNRAEALSPRNIAIGVGGLALTAVFLWLIGQMAKRALARAIAQSTTPEHGGAPLAP